MTPAQDVDAESLQEELRLIQDAMGIGERYPSRLRDWLVFGVLVAVASGISQYVHLQALPSYWHPVVWFLIMGGGGLLAVRWGEGHLVTTDTKPSIPLQFLAAFVAYLPMLVIVSPLADGMGYRQESMLVLGLVLVLLGIAYLGVGNALRAYRIRRRDRFAFYLGGLGMMALGGLMPHSPFLVEWGYATFGALYLVYALLAYAVLAQS